MRRRDFFEWAGKVSLALGLGYLSARADAADPAMPEAVPPRGLSKPGTMRMNGRACHDYRMISSDRSMIIDREIFLG